jgi:hypothetical protein
MLTLSWPPKGTERRKRTREVGRRPSTFTTNPILGFTTCSDLLLIILYLFIGIVLLIMNDL